MKIIFSIILLMLGYSFSENYSLTRPFLEKDYGNIVNKACIFTNL